MPFAVAVLKSILSDLSSWITASVTLTNALMSSDMNETPQE